MLNKKSLFRVSLGLIMVNLVLLGFLFFNHFDTQRKLNKIQEKAKTEVLGSTNIPIFDPNFLMSDDTFSSTRAFPTEASVQNYLDSRNSVLKDYREQNKLASYWIFAAARGQTSSRHGVNPRINPGVLIAYLEKEQSLISLTNYDTNKDPQNRIKTAMGYGCPDGAKCEERFFGLVNQLNWAAYQLQFNFDRAQTASNLVAPYHVNKTISTLDEYNVFLSNAATAANYRYTPHVYWGNYNLWKIITANGWGVSSQTYSMAEIDRINLPNKDKDIITVDTGQPISLEEIRPILTKSYTYGETGENIKKLQRFLRQRGYFMNRQITGMYGLITEKAHKNFNRDNGILNTTPTNGCIELFNREWRIGQEGQEVRELQVCLRDAGYFDWPIITGYYGEVTRAGLVAIRKALNGETKPLPDPIVETPKNPVEIPVATGKVKTVSKETTTNGLNMRNSACGDRITTIAWNTEGNKLRGPVSRSCLGGNWNWYEVQFGNQKGWVVDFYLENINSQENQNTTQTPEPVIVTSPENPKPKPIIEPERVMAIRKDSAAPALNFRSAPCGNRIATINWGQVGEKLSESRNQTCFGRNWKWQKVRFNGQIGWVADFYLKDVSKEETVKTNSRGENIPGLNIRDSACGNRVSMAGWGEIGVKLQGPVRRNCFGRNWDWYEVQFNGQKGWVAGFYLD